MDENARHLARKIDEGLMELDYQLCQRATRDGLPRTDIAVVDLSSQAFAGMLAALAQDHNLWAEFCWEVRAPREPAFERLYHRALLIGRCRQTPSPDTDPKQAMEACDPHGLTRRINAHAGQSQLDGLTVGAMAYVLGRKPAIWKAFQAAVGQPKAGQSKAGQPKAT